MGWKWDKKRKIYVGTGEDAGRTRQQASFQSKNTRTAPGGKVYTSDQYAKSVRAIPSKKQSYADAVYGNKYSVKTKTPNLGQAEQDYKNIFAPIAPKQAETSQRTLHQSSLAETSQAIAKRSEETKKRWEDSATKNTLYDPAANAEVKKHKDDILKPYDDAISGAKIQQETSERKVYDTDAFIKANAAKYTGGSAESVNAQAINAVRTSKWLSDEEKEKKIAELQDRTGTQEARAALTDVKNNKAQVAGLKTDKKRTEQAIDRQTYEAHAKADPAFDEISRRGSEYKSKLANYFKGSDFERWNAGYLDDNTVAYNMLTPDEVKTYTYYLTKNNGDETVANKYLDSLMPDLQERTASMLDEKIESIDNEFLKKTARGSLTVGGANKNTQRAFMNMSAAFTGSDDVILPGVIQQTQQKMRSRLEGPEAFVNDVLYSGVQMGPTFAANMIPGVGQAAGTAMIMATSYSDAYSGAIAQGYDPSEAVAYAVPSAVAEGLTQYALNGVKAFGASSELGKIVSNAAQKVSKDPAVQKVMMSLGNMGGEALEEYLQANIDPILRNLALGEDNVIDPFSQDKLEAALMGAILSGTMNAPEYIADTTQSRAQNKAQQQLTDDLYVNMGTMDALNNPIAAEADSIVSSVTGQDLGELSKNRALTEQAETQADAIVNNAVPNYVQPRHETRKAADGENNWYLRQDGSTDYEAVYERATGLQGEINELTAEISSELGTKYEPATQKSIESMKNKTNRKQAAGQDYSVLDMKDHARNKIMMKDFSQISEVERMLGERGIPFESEIVGPTRYGYTGYHITFRNADGLSAELQLTTPEAWKAKLESDKIYEKWRNSDDAELGQTELDQKDADIQRSNEMWAQLNLPDFISSSTSSGESVRPLSTSSPNSGDRALRQAPSKNSLTGALDSSTSRPDSVNTYGESFIQDTSLDFWRDMSTATSQEDSFTALPRSSSENGTASTQAPSLNSRGGENLRSNMRSPQASTNADLPTQSTPSNNIINKKDGNGNRQYSFEGENTRTRQAAKSMLESPNLSEGAGKALSEAIERGEFQYVPVSNRRAIEAASEWIAKKGGVGDALSSWLTLAEEGRIGNKTQIAQGEQLLAELSDMGDTEGFMKLAAELAAEGTRAGQMTQAFSMIDKLTPQGRMVYVQRQLANINREYAQKFEKKALKNPDKAWKDIELSQETADAIMNAKNVSELNAAEEMAAVEIAQKLPSSMGDKLRAWRYLSMLGNLRTHARNIVGNAFMRLVTNGRDLIATGLEHAFVPEGERTKAVLTPKDRQNVQFAKAQFEQSKRAMLSDGKYGMDDVIDQNRKIFNTRWLEFLRTLNNKGLEGADAFFMKGAYANAFAQMMKARGYTQGFLESGTKAGNTALQQVQQYATRQALEMTFREYSKTAAALNNLARNHKGAAALMDAVLPFRKTPINILKQGLRYSPAGLVERLTRGVKQLANGNISASEFVEGVSSGLTGTGIMAIGYLLGASGIILAGSGDDREGRLENDQGYQGYSIKIGDNTYSLDWLAPVSIPLFMGVEMANMENDDEGDPVSRFFTAIMNSANPVMDMSILQSVDDFMSAYRNDGGMAALGSMAEKAAESYAGQYIPTLFGQIARSADPTRRTTYAGKNGPLPKELESFFRRMANKIPGLSYLNEPYVDIFGREQVNGGNVLTRYLENGIAPWYRSGIKDDPLANEALRVYDAVGETSALPHAPQSSFRYGDTNYSMTPDEFTQYKKTYGKFIKTNGDAMITSKAYAALSDGQKAKALASLSEDANKIAKQEMLKNRGISYDQADLSVGTAMSDNVGEMYAYKAGISGTDNDTDKRAALLNTGFEGEALVTAYEKQFEKLGTDSRTAYENSIRKIYDSGGDVKKFIELKSQPFFNKEYLEKNDVNQKLEAEKWLFENAGDEDIAPIYAAIFEGKDTNERDTIAFAQTQGVRPRAFLQREIQKADEEGTPGNTKDDAFYMDGQIVVDEKGTTQSGTKKSVSLTNILNGDYTPEEKVYFYQREMPADDKFSYYAAGGLPVDDYLQAYAYFAPLRADYDENGKTISGSKKKKYIDFLASTGMSEQQQLYFLAREYTLNGSEAQAVREYIGGLSASDEIKESLLASLKLDSSSGGRGGRRSSGGSKTAAKKAARLAMEEALGAPGQTLPKLDWSMLTKNRGTEGAAPKTGGSADPVQAMVDIHNAITKQQKEKQEEAVMPWLLTAEQRTNARRMEQEKYQ